MAKIGRNDPCPCGSGKKFKKCCSLTGEKTQGDKTSSLNCSLPRCGIPGQQEGVIAQRRFVDPTDPRNAVPPTGAPGKYRVTFTLSRPGFSLTPEGKHSFEHGLRGDSHLAIAKPAFEPPGNPSADRLVINTQTQHGILTFEGHPNERGFLGKLVLESIDASDSIDARQEAYRLLAPSLSNKSVHLDIPLNIYQTDVVELYTGTESMTIANPFLEVPMSMMPSGVMSDEFRAYASIYREALNSNTVVYQFLCFFKILEAVRIRRARIASAAKTANEVRRFVEKVPSEQQEFVPWLSAIFPVRREWDPIALSSIFVQEARGKKFGAVIEHHLLPLRTRIAHAISQSGELLLSADEALDVSKVEWLPLAKCMARRMLKNEFPSEFLPYLKEDGTIQA